MIRQKKNRNIKGLQIGPDAAKPGTLTTRPPPPSSSQQQQQEQQQQHHQQQQHQLQQAPTKSRKETLSSSSQASLSNESSESTSSASFPSTANTGASTHNPSNNYHNRLNEQLATLELGIEFKLEIRSEDLSIIRDLGSGNSGTVSKVKHNPTGATMARKLVHIDAKPEVRKQILRELQIMHDCHSPHIVSFYGAYLSDPYVCLCMEFMEKGSLDQIYRKTGPIPQMIVSKIAFAVLSGLTYLYDVHRIIHRDVKPSNILVNTSGSIKICDFGVSGELINSIADTFVGTSTYMSPERIQGAKYTVKSDVWSLGITLVELALGRFPFEDEPEDEDHQITIPSHDDNLTLSPARPSQKDQIVSERAAQQQQQQQQQQQKSSKRKPTKKSKDKQQRGGLGMSILELLQHVVNEPAPKLPESRFPQDIRDFVDACLEKDFEKRPTPKELMTFPWLVETAECDVDLEAWARSLP